MSDEPSPSNQAATILVVDDDPQQVRLLQVTLSEVGYRVLPATDGRQALRLFYEARPDLVILDVSMPGMGGQEVLRQLRLMADIPVMMLTALGSDEDIVAGLDTGADEYLVKPVSKRVLLARVRATLRRLGPAADQGHAVTFSDGYLTIDSSRRLVLLEGEPLALSDTEFRYLAYLVRHAGQVVTHQQILESVWGWEYQDSLEYSHIYMSSLRKKIEADGKNPRYLHTVRGVGYRFSR